MAMASCQKEVEFCNVQEKINVKIEDEVYIEEGKLVFFEFEVLPADASQYRISTALYYERLLQDPYFVSVVKQRWSQYKENFRTLPEFIQQKADEICSSESFNYAMWPVTSNVNKDINLSFDSAVERMIQGYNQKFNWLDSAIGKM